MSRDDFNPAAHGLRGIASLMVFYAHIIGGTAEHVYQDRPDYVGFVQHPWNFGVYGVDLFFVISGFVILPSALKYGPRDFALRRFFRLYPLFIVFTIIFAVLNSFTNAYPKLNDLQSIIAGMTFMNLFTHTEQITPNAWSLTYEVFYYALTCLSVYFLVKRPNAIAAGLMLALSAAFLVRYPISIYFLIGLTIRCLYDKNYVVPAALARYLELPALLCCVFFASRGHFDYRWSDFNDPVVAATIASTAVYFYLAVAKDSMTSRLLQNRYAAYFGTVSYSLYLVHPYTYLSCRQVFSRLHLFTPNIATSMLLFFLVVTPLTLLLTHVVHVKLELGPYRWFFHQDIYRTRLGQTWRRRLRLGA